jgi:hypothetical protein
LDLNQTISADGARYANSDESFVFWSKGDGALVLENNVEKSYLGCTAWKTYQNLSKGFEVLYPTNWQVRENDGEQYEPVNGTKLVELYDIVCCKFSFDDGMDFKIFYSSGFSKYPNLNYLLAEREKIYPTKNYILENYKVGDFNGLLIKSKAVAGSEYAELYLKNDTGFYTVLWNAMDPNNKGFTASAYLEKIILSLKFITN